MLATENFAAFAHYNRLCPVQSPGTHNEDLVCRVRSWCAYQAYRGASMGASSLLCRIARRAPAAMSGGVLCTAGEGGLTPGVQLQSSSRSLSVRQNC